MILRDELLKRWWIADPFRPSDDALHYYEIKHQIVARLQPKSICEIGVRAGYGAYAFMSAVPHDTPFLGIDVGTHQAVDENEASMCARNAETIIKEFPGAGMLWRNSHSLKRIPGNYEFVHVDADHTYQGCGHDLYLAAKTAKWILVDDFDVGPEVRAACRDFLLASAGEWMAEYIPDGFRGNLLLVGTGHS